MSVRLDLSKYLSRPPVAFQPAATAQPAVATATATATATVSADQIAAARTLVTGFGDKFKLSAELSVKLQLGVADVLPPPPKPEASTSTALSSLNSMLSGIISKNEATSAQAKAVAAAVTQTDTTNLQKLGSLRAGVVGPSLTSQWTAAKIDQSDKFALPDACRGGQKTINLSNSPHIVLALYNIFKSHGWYNPGQGTSKENLVKILGEEYGIHAKTIDIAGLPGGGIQFDNGAIMGDSRGDGTIEMGDYNFEGAIKQIKEQYGDNITEKTGADFKQFWHTDEKLQNAHDTVKKFQDTALSDFAKGIFSSAADLAGKASGAGAFDARAILDKYGL